MLDKNHLEAKEIINTLTNGNFYCECPCGCGEEIKLKDADLFFLEDFSTSGKEAKKNILDDLKQRRLDLKKREINMTKRSQITTKAVNIGSILERIVTSFDHFPFQYNDCRSLFDPIDYIIFEGLNKSGVVSKIIFTDIKTGNAKLKANQKSIKALVEDKKIEFKTF